jgi:hypothetical protein
MKTYTEAQIMQALDAIKAGHGTIKPSNLANRFQGLIQAATPELLADLADAFAAVASKHPGELGAFTRSLATEVLAESYTRQTARKDQ